MEDKGFGEKVPFDVVESHVMGQMGCRERSSRSLGLGVRVDESARRSH